MQPIIVAVARLLLDSEEMQQFDRARVFLDEDFTAVEKFTVSIITLIVIASLICMGLFVLSLLFDSLTPCVLSARLHYFVIL